MLYLELSIQLNLSGGISKKFLSKTNKQVEKFNRQNLNMVLTSGRFKPVSEKMKVHAYIFFCVVNRMVRMTFLYL